MLKRSSHEENGMSKVAVHAHVNSAPSASPKKPVMFRTASGRSMKGHKNLSISDKLMYLSENSSMAPAANASQHLGFTDMLQYDERPTFVLDLSEKLELEAASLLRPAFVNNTLASMPTVLERATGSAEGLSPTTNRERPFSEFRAWATCPATFDNIADEPLPFFAFAGILWTSSLIRKRYRVIQGSAAATVPTSNLPLGGTHRGILSASSLSLSSQGRREPGSSADNEVEDYFGPTAGQMAKVSATSGNTYIQSPLGSPLNYPKAGALASNVEAAPVDSEQQIQQEPSVQALTIGDLPIQTCGPSPGPGSNGAYFFDWTRLPDSPSLPQHIRFARSVDWSKTALGPMEQWSPDLRSMCNLIMASPHPAAMYWSEQFIAIYNEAYILLAGSKHPQLMGQSYREAWPEIWDNVKDVFDSAIKTGRATMRDDDCLFISRSIGDDLEETYFSWSIIPLVGSDGSVVGLYNPAFEKTRRKVAERRMFTLRELGDRTATAREQRRFWPAVLKGLEYNEFDAPFVLLYVVSEEVDSDSQSSLHSSGLSGNKTCVLEGSIGIPNGHPAAPARIDLRDGTHYLAKLFGDSMGSERPIHVSVASGTLEPNLLDGIEWRGFGDACTSAVCCHIHVPSEEQTTGFLVMGCNPRRPYDDDYSLYVQLLGRQLATALASVVLFEEEIARGRRAARIAALEQIELSEQLRATEQQAVESETKFTRMSQLNPVGLFIADSTGRITYCNEKWYEISKVPNGALGFSDWMDVVKDEDKVQFLQGWKELVENALPLDMEIRFKTKWRDRNGNEGDTWVLAMAHPEKDDHGRMDMIFGSITDISPQKWAEHFEKRRMEEAVKLKRQQENFIDITSHEMRNPLSAMLQCADEIQSSLTHLKSGVRTKESEQQVQNVLSNAIEASNTIALCAQHQKRIVDDILTLSKLDSALLLVTPCATEPKSVVQRALRMFDNELQSHEISINFKVDESMDRLNISWVKMDPSRVLQVLINLTTNSIKFTSMQAKRVITVTLGATLDRVKHNGPVKFVPSRSERRDLTENTDEWGQGEQVYIHFSVQDTGRGLTSEEQQMLFLRFSQTSPRTHVQYGGSGLGLFISRELVDLQGGEIGVASIAGEGSTFAFYIKARRCDPAPTEMQQLSGLSQRRIVTDNSEIKAGSTGNGVPQSSMSNEALKILIVEDNVVNQKVLARQLRNFGCVVHVANQGEECLERLRESTFWANPRSQEELLDINVVLMDQEMPVMDGLTCTKEIRRLERKGDIKTHVPIIAVTANARSEQIKTVLSAGMDDVVAKPFRITDLIPKVEELLAKFPHPPF